VTILKRLIEAEEFEQFLNRTFPGQKRFSIEGVDMMVPMMDEIIYQAVHDGVESINIGMAHRGRLNVLAHILGKPYEVIFSEFYHAPDKTLVPSEGSMGINYGWTGDVKYHLGADREYREGETIHARLTLANNPSHLEFVNPVVGGFTRAAQEERNQPGFPEQNVKKALSILVHGDAAFPGEGIVAETLNLSRLRGFHTGGAIHIIANNQLGFTTESVDSRSTQYASDLAKGFEIPIVHVNADDPEACLAAVYLAYQYRRRFQKDFLIDLIGYRRFGHNEMDDPVATQPTMYAKIQNHPSVRVSYAKVLQEENVVTHETIKEMEKQVQEKLREALRIAKEHKEPVLKEMMAPQKSTPLKASPLHTSVSVETLFEINRELLKVPEGFRLYPKLERVLKRRADALEHEGKVDWSLAEALAFATILRDGTPIRMTGQDTERGTFAHRHFVLHDPETGKSYCPLHHISKAKASFAVHNSPLSEAAVLGFEYGYNVFAPETLCLWEAQFGDFANAGQVIIDQFISSGRAKWKQNSSLILLLPHGYEGQGPEHSSARLERYLQLAAENNWTVVNLTSAAQYFHLLRRQAILTGTDEARPLVVMSPKSLLRHERAVSHVTEFAQGTFRKVLEPRKPKATEQVQRLILCSGKVAIDLEKEWGTKYNQESRIHMVRVEQLYPFPEKELQQVIQRLPKLKEILWVQEEPHNMGAWGYIQPLLHQIAPSGIPVKYVGRPERSSPAEGLPDMHHLEQERIVTEALMLDRSQ
jgi:2-oxoglutarate dehydrogenase E1 component